MKLCKRLIALMMVVAMTFAIASCGAANEDDGKYTIGICQLLDHPALNAATEGFKQAVIDALGEEKVKFDYQNAANDANLCVTICNQFASANVDLIMANATPALTAATKATKTIPVLGTSITEYGVALSIDNFDGTVGGNVSGTSDLAPLDEQAAMLAEWFPDAKNVGLLYCSAEANSQYQVDVVKVELEKAGLTATLYSFSDSNDIAGVVENAAASSDVIYVPTDNTVAANTALIDNICRPAGIPVIAGEEGICSGCGVATLSISYYDLGVATGKMAAQILTGEADISTMPVGYAATVTPPYNADICAALNITPLDGYEAIG